MGRDHFTKGMMLFVFIVSCLSSSGNLTTGNVFKNPFYEDDSIQVWWSSELLPGSARWFTDPPHASEIKYKLSRQKNIGWESKYDKNSLTFRIDTGKSFQSVLGIGTSLEATTIYALLKNKNEEQVRKYIRLIIDPEKGMGLNLFRITIGTSDFSDGRKVSSHPKGFYTYQDDKGKPFSIQPDFDLGIIKVLQMFVEEASILNQEIHFFASVWSPPAWMKTSENLIGGTLKPGYEKQLAKYFRQFIDAYSEKGIPVYAITIQNEPNFTPDDYPGMLLSPQQEKEIAVAVYNEFNNTGGGKRKIETRIWINDHNMNYWTNADKILKELKESGLNKAVDGTAFHNYNPMASPKNMTKLHDSHPEKTIHLTEHSEWGVSGMANIQEYFMNWSSSYVYWVTMTTQKPDEHNQGPYNNISALGPPLFIESKSDSSAMNVTPEFYLLSQFSRFIRPGAVRLECEKDKDKNVTSVVFMNSDKSIVQVLVNKTGTDKFFTTIAGGRSFNGKIPAKSVGSFIWNAGQ